MGTSSSFSLKKKEWLVDKQYFLYNYLMSLATGCSSSLRFEISADAK
jgi:hypothetical protein